MAYVPDQACLMAARAAAGKDLPESEILAAFERVSQHRDRLIASGQGVGMEARLRRYAAEQGQKAQRLAQVQRANAARNAVIHDKVMEQLNGFIQAGIRPRDALLAFLEGTQKAVRNARKSVAALTEGFRDDYIGAMFREVQRDAPHIQHMLDDQRFDGDILAEMMEIKPGGKPGVTGNKDAVYMAQLFSKYAELARLEHNRLGGMMGKLHGWNGVQMHDDYKMAANPGDGKSAKEAWIGFIASKLDMERTFPDGLTDVEVHDALASMFDTIITGVPNKPTAKEMGKRVGPAGLAKSFAASRVLHFRDAQASLEYRERYGYGNTIKGMISHLDRLAKTNANMTALGPNPEVMFDGLVAEVQRYIRDATEVPPGVTYGLPFQRYRPSLELWKSTEIGKINTQAGPLRHALDIATGLASRPVDVTLARIGSNARAVQSMSKLGAALVSSISDIPTAAAAAMFRGENFFVAMSAHLGNMRDFFSDPAVRELAYLYGEGFDGLIGHLNAVVLGNDRTDGRAGRLLETFFKWNGLTAWTDAGRASAAQMAGASLGRNAHLRFDSLDPRLAHVLDMNGIGAKEWDAMRSSSTVLVNGRSYITPDGVAALPDATIAPLVAERIAAARVTSRVDQAVSAATRAKRQALFEARRASILVDGRRDLVMALRRYVSDETGFGVITTDARARRTMTMGSRAGTPLGEAVRLMMQFKGFPIAFGQRVAGRAIFGHREGAAGEQALHIGTLLAGMTIAGYMAMSIKDMIKGYWPPRNPADPRTVLAAFQQGGALGIYGDFLFGSTNRFGGTLLETLAGPTVGSVSQLFDIGLDARDYATSGGEDKFSSAKAFSTLSGMVPYANLAYVKPVIDYLYLNSLREALSPGYLRRQRSNREKEEGQGVWHNQTLQQSPGRGFLATGL